MSLKIEVKSSTIQEINGVSKLGKPYHIRKQVAYAFTHDPVNGELNAYPSCRKILHAAPGMPKTGMLSKKSRQQKGRVDSRPADFNS
jgi:hypothetical protein